MFESKQEKAFKKLTTSIPNLNNTNISIIDKLEDKSILITCSINELFSIERKYIISYDSILEKNISELAQIFYDLDYECCTIRNKKLLDLALNIKFKENKTFDELIAEGKSFKEINQIMKVRNKI